MAFFFFLLVNATLFVRPMEIVPDLEGARLYEFFIRQWEAEISGLTQSGFTVNRRSPVLHTQARTESRGSGRSDRSSRQFVTGRDLVVGAAIVLLGGVSMLVAGVMLDISWLATAGGVSLAILFVLGLLIIFLS